MDSMDLTQADTISMEMWEELAKEGSEAVITVNTNGISMWPLLRSRNDSVRITYPRRELMIGDFIMFHRADGKEIAHRICWMDDTMLETLGDNCTYSDGKFPRSKVVGLVTHVCRKGHLIHVDTPFWRGYGRFMIWSNPFRMFVRKKIYHPLRHLAARIIKGNKNRS